MNNIPPALKKYILTDPYYKKCCLEDEECQYESGHRQIEWHHAIIYAGKQLQKKWAIVPVCSGFHHKYADRSDIKERIVRVCVMRATKEELKEVSKAIDYVKLKEKYENSY